MEASTNIEYSSFRQLIELGMVAQTAGRRCDLEAIAQKAFLEGTPAVVNMMKEMRLQAMRAEAAPRVPKSAVDSRAAAPTAKPA